MADRKKSAQAKKAGNTPENTSWTMRLLTRLDKVFPSGVLDLVILDWGRWESRLSRRRSH
jgi:hypothetical protein